MSLDVSAGRAGEGLTPVSCRDCGKLGLEAWHDPAPGLCPRCFDRRMLDAAFALAARGERRALLTADLAWYFRRLVDVGLRPAAASRGVRTVAAGLGLPCPKVALVAADLRWERAAVEAVRTLEWEAGNPGEGGARYEP